MKVLVHAHLIDMLTLPMSFFQLQKLRSGFGTRSQRCGTLTTQDPGPSTNALICTSPKEPLVCRMSQESAISPNQSYSKVGINRPSILLDWDGLDSWGLKVYQFQKNT